MPILLTPANPYGYNTSQESGALSKWAFRPAVWVSDYGDLGGLGKISTSKGRHNLHLQ